MTDKEYLIRYRTTPDWFVPIVTAAAIIAGLWLLFFVPLLLVPPDFFGMHVNLFVFNFFLRAVGIFLITFLAYFVCESARHDTLTISKDGLSFPLLVAPDLLFRRRRSWDDIGNILLGAMLAMDKKGTYEYELEEGKDKKQLFFYFKSGGHVSLDLTRIPKEGQEKLFLAIQDWCIQCNRSPQLSAKKKIRDKDKTPQKKGKKAEELSYTQLWEEELQAHFSATNFVPLEKGSQLKDGEYSILMQLASGGLSAVYLAELPDQELVVLKEAALPPTIEDATKRKAKELFEREAIILKRLSHPRIARVIDTFVERGRDYLVLEFVPGQSLRQLVRKHGTQSEQVVLKHAKQIAEVLDFLHDQDPPIVHRDITPDNLLLREDGELVLIDFGAANELLGSATGTLVGKQAYIAPEQFRGKACAQSDIYALGGTLHFLLTGEDPEALSVSHPRKNRPDVSEEIDALIARCTHLEPEKRYSAAHLLMEEIDHLLPGTVLNFSPSGTADGFAGLER